MNTSPFQTFLLSLETDGIRLSVRDYERLAKALRQPGDWTPIRLRDVLVSLLARSIDQHDLLRKRFESHFETGIEPWHTPHKPFDIDRLQEELRTLKVKAPVPDTPPVRPPPSHRKQPHQQPSRFQRWRKPLLAIVLFAALAGLSTFLIINYWPQPPKLSLAFSSAATATQPGKPHTWTIPLTNTGGGELTIISVATADFPEKYPGFSQTNDCQNTVLTSNESCQITVQFQADTPDNYQAELNIQNSIEPRSIKLAIRVVEPPPPRSVTATPGDLFPIPSRQPVIHTIKAGQMPDNNAWRRLYSKTTPGISPWLWPALLGLLLLGVIIAYCYYLWRHRQPVKDTPADWNPDGPRRFSVDTLGGEPAPRLSRETLMELADSMGYFRGALASHRPDIDASVRATVANGGIPELILQRRKQLRHLIILVDGDAGDALQLNPVPQELRDGMTRLGVELTYGQFFGDPGLFHDADGQTHYLEDMEAERRAYLLLIFCDSRNLNLADARYTLENLCLWPQVAWFELRERKLWEAITRLPVTFGIPCYYACAEDLLAAFARFLTEAATTTDKATDESGWLGMPPQADTPLAIHVESLLGSTLPWAQACAMIQPVTFGLADALRREFYPDIPPSHIEYLDALPGATRSVNSLRFSDDMLSVLRRGFVTRHDEAEQDAVLQGILSYLEDHWQTLLESQPELAGSLAELGWRKQYARVQLETAPDAALAELAALEQTPLGNAVKADLEQAVSVIPLRKMPQTHDGRQRLGRLAKGSGIPTLQSYPLARWQVAVLGGLMLLTGALNWVAWTLKDAEPPTTTAEVVTAEPISAYTVLESTARDNTLVFYRDSETDWEWASLALPDTLEQAATIYVGTAPRNASEAAATNSRLALQAPAANLSIARATVKTPLFSQSVWADKTPVLTTDQAWQLELETLDGKVITWPEPLPLAAGDIDLDALLAYETREYFRDPMNDGGFGPQMVSITGGTFSMGSPDNEPRRYDDEGPLHQVTVSDFAIGRYEVTFAEYDRFAEATNREKPDDRGWGRGNRPVINVTWEDAQAYATWLSEQTSQTYRLPTEAEWEYAARSGSQSAFWWGDEIGENQANCWSDDSKDGWPNTSPVGTFAANAYGLHDTAGNVMEWVQDWSGSYSQSPAVDPTGPATGDDRVLRGGAWRGNALDCRSAFRARRVPSFRDFIIGFRLARTDPQPFYTFTLDDVARLPEMVLVPGGRFMMGSPEDEAGRFDDEGPQHEVQVEAFAIGKYEVTFAEYDAFAEANKRKKPNDQGWGRGQRPVINVSWEDAQAYAQWLSEETGLLFRLPTEAEWEYAARAGTETAYWWGDDAGQENMNCAGNNDKTTEVGQYAANKFGLHDTAGNVYEWVQDWHGSYSQSFAVNPIGPATGDIRVLRGGAWNSGAQYCRSAYRNRYGPSVRIGNIGFRLASTDPRLFYPVTLGEDTDEAEDSPRESTAPFTDKLQDDSEGPSMVTIPAGRFVREGNEISVSAFSIGQYEVTFADYDKFAEATKREKPDDSGFGRQDNRPVINVSWNDAQAYAEWLSEQTGEQYRLPTEAEWEYAARAGTTTDYWWGDEPGQNTMNCGQINEQTVEVGQYDASKFGLYDTAGNVYEWVQDWYDNYPKGPQVDPAGPARGDYRVLRGGSWHIFARYCRSADRGSNRPSDRDSNVGFRLARTNPYPSSPSQTTAVPQTVVLKDGQSFTDPMRSGGEGPQMVVVPAGKFEMGDVQGGGFEQERPVHTVTLARFAVGVNEVTVAEYLRCVSAEACRVPEWQEVGSEYHIETGSNDWYKRFGEALTQENYPIVGISWEDAQAYATWLSQETGQIYRLPTEAEWEYAARAGTDTKYWWGNEMGNNLANCKNDASGDDWEYTSPVGSFKPNDFGLHDTVGNVWEWVEDWYADDYYAQSPAENPTGPAKGDDRVLRGGSWDYGARNCRSALRGRGVPSLRFFNIGFRLARTIP